jgi:hypothetical protein
MKKNEKALEKEHQQKIHEYVVAFLKENPEPRTEEWAIRAAIERELRKLFRVLEQKD